MARFLLALVAVLAIASSAEAALSARNVVETLGFLTTKTQNLQQPASSISIVNGPLILIGQGPYPAIISGITDIVSTTNTFLAQFEGTGPFDDKDDVAAVRGAFQSFVTVHQQLLNILIGKSSLFPKSPFIGDPVSKALRADEGAIDSIGFSLINVCESQAEPLQELLNSLDATLATAVSSYEGDILLVE